MKKYHPKFGDSKRKIDRNKAASINAQEKESEITGRLEFVGTLAGNSEVENAIRKGLETLNSLGTMPPNVGNYKFVEIRMGDIESDGQRAVLTDLSAALSRVSQLHFPTTFSQKPYGDPYKIPGNKNPRRDFKFSIELKEFDRLCQQYGVAIRPNLKQRIDTSKGNDHEHPR